MSYIASYGGYVFDSGESIDLIRIKVLSEKAKKGEELDDKYTEYEKQIYQLMLDLIEFGENKRNYYEKLPKPDSQKLHVL